MICDKTWPLVAFAECHSFYDEEEFTPLRHRTNDTPLRSQRPVYFGQKAISPQDRGKQSARKEFSHGTNEHTRTKATDVTSWERFRNERVWQHQPCAGHRFLDHQRVLPHSTDYPEFGNLLRRVTHHDRVRTPGTEKRSEAAVGCRYWAHSWVSSTHCIHLLDVSCSNTPRRMTLVKEPVFPA